jgi:hypothetical protein
VRFRNTLCRAGLGAFWELGHSGKRITSTKSRKLLPRVEVVFHFESPNSGFREHSGGFRLAQARVQLVSISFLMVAQLLIYVRTLQIPYFGAFL